MPNLFEDKVFVGRIDEPMDLMNKANTILSKALKSFTKQQRDDVRQEIQLWKIEVENCKKFIQSILTPEFSKYFENEFMRINTSYKLLKMIEFPIKTLEREIEQNPYSNKKLFS